jgi:hypothetical protein
MGNSLCAFQLNLTVPGFLLLLVGVAMNGAGAEVPGSSSTRLENPSDVFGEFVPKPELLSKNGSSEDVRTAEAFERRDVPTGNTSDKQNFIEAHETRLSRVALGGNSIETSTVIDTATADVVSATAESSVSEFETVSSASVPPTPPLPSSTAADVLWEGFKRKKHGYHKAQGSARLLEAVAKGMTERWNRRGDRGRRL